MRSSHGFYIFTISPLVYPCVSPPHPPLEDFIGERQGSDCSGAQPNPPHICQTPLPVYHSILEFPPNNFWRRRRNFLNIKSALRVMVMEGISMGTNLLHLSSTAGTTILSPFYPYASLIMPNMWHFS